jgi:hypothetical protein
LHDPKEWMMKASIANVVVMMLLAGCASVASVPDYGVVPIAASTFKPLCRGGSSDAGQALGCLGVMTEQAIIHAAQQ